MMRAAARSASSAGVAAALTMGLAGCGESDKGLALEAARGACAATLQALYDPISTDQAVTVPRVANTSTDAEKFEFIWKRDQISGLLWRSLPQEMEEDSDIPRRPSATERQIVLEAITPAGERVLRLPRFARRTLDARRVAAPARVWWAGHRDQVDKASRELLKSRPPLPDTGQSL